MILLPTLKLPKREFWIHLLLVEEDGKWFVKQQFVTSKHPTYEKPKKAVKVKKTSDNEEFSFEVNKNGEVVL